jgi:hypothetical protein
LGNKRDAPGFLPMRIREENRNVVLLATVTIFTAVIAAVISMVDLSPAPADSKPYVAEQRPVRAIGVPFVPNVNPRER